MERKARTQLIIGIGFMVAAIMVVVAGYGLISDQNNGDANQGRGGQSIQGQDLTEVWIASRPLNRGTILTDEDMSRLIVAGDVPTGAVMTSRSIRGRYVREDIVLGQLLLEPVLADDPSEIGLAALVPEGHRAIAIKVSDEIAVGNFIRPGDFVDVQYVLKEAALVASRRMATGGDTSPAAGEDRSEARILIQNLEVLSIGPLIKGDDAQQIEPYRNVTLAVAPDQASILALARDMGQYYLSLRGLEDHEVAEDKTIIVDDLRGEDAKARVARRQREAAREAGVQPVTGTRRKVQILGGR